MPEIITRSVAVNMLREKGMGCETAREIVNNLPRKQDGKLQKVWEVDVKRKAAEWLERPLMRRRRRF